MDHEDIDWDDEYDDLPAGCGWGLVVLLAGAIGLAFVLVSATR